MITHLGKAALNGVCPYFTMFPLEFPFEVLHGRAKKGDRILDPFCGRGTTLYASRLLGLPSAGVDASAVAVALTAAKLANATPPSIMAAFDSVLEAAPRTRAPRGDFWNLAYDADALDTMCQLRASLLEDCESASRVALRAILMGALHGPINKRPSYFSNQAPRTFAPKPDYSARFWRTRNLVPPRVNIRQIVLERARRYYGGSPPRGEGQAILGDSRRSRVYAQLGERARFSWIISSPPYYGMRTYVPDQWLRNWFVGGPARVDYSMRRQLRHESPEGFSAQLRGVWEKVRTVSRNGSRMVLRFGGINDRQASPKKILWDSMKNSGWRIQTLRDAGLASAGRRQALHFLKAPQGQTAPVREFDVWARAC